MPARSHSNALLAKAEKQLQLGEMQKAIDLCQQVLSKKPRHPEANTLMMHATQASGDLKSAYHYARQALATDQNNPEYLLSTALILHEAKKSDEAIVLAKRVLEIDSQFSDAYLFLGELHHQLLDHDQAL